MGFGGGPRSLQQAVVAGVDLAAGGELGRGEEVQLFAGAGAGNIEEALAFGRLAGAMEVFETSVEGVLLHAFARNGGEHDMSSATVGQVACCVRVDFGPSKQVASVASGLTLQSRHDNDIPLQTLGFMDCH